jgi:hypothetical protein
MKNLFKKIFGSKEKPTPPEPLLANTEDEKSVPDENIVPRITIEREPTYTLVDKKETDKAWEELEKLMKEEPIAPTLERQEEISGSSIDDAVKEVHKFYWKEKMDAIPKEKIEMIKKNLDELDKKNKKPKKQAKKKDNFNDDASKPKGRNFLI